MTKSDNMMRVLFSWGIAYSYCTRNTYKFGWAVQLLDAVNISVNLILARDTVEYQSGRSKLMYPHLLQLLLHVIQSRRGEFARRRQK